MKGNEKGWGEQRQKVLVSHPSSDPNRVNVGHSWTKMGSNDSTIDIIFAFLVHFVSTSHLYVYFSNFNLLFRFITSLSFLHFFYFAFSPCIPAPPPGYRMKAGEAALQGKKRWEKIFLSFHRLFLSFKKVTFLPCTCTKQHRVGYAKATLSSVTFADIVHHIGF